MDLSITSVAITNDAKSWFSLCDAVATPIQLEPNDLFTVRVRCRPKTSDFLRTATLVIGSTDPDTPEKQVSLTCHLAP